MKIAEHPKVFRVKTVSGLELESVCFAGGHIVGTSQESSHPDREPGVFKSNRPWFRCHLKTSDCEESPCPRTSLSSRGHELTDDFGGIRRDL